MQDDALIGILTVRENIQFAVDICFPTNYSHEERERKRERKERIQSIIQEFGLEMVADNKKIHYPPKSIRPTNKNCIVF